VSLSTDPVTRARKILFFVDTRLVESSCDLICEFAAESKCRTRPSEVWNANELVVGLI
jgi:hypothetical protein